VFVATRNVTMTGNVLFGSFSGRPAQLELLEPPQSGEFTFDNGQFTYRPTELRSVVNFTVRATDGVSQSVPTTFAILIANSAPFVPFNAEFNATQGQPLTTASGAKDFDGDAIAFELLTPPAKGTLTFATDGNFTYTPATDASGDDVFVYSARDALRTSGNSGTVTIHIQASGPTTPPVDPPPLPPSNPPSSGGSGGGGGGSWDLLSALALLLFGLARGSRRRATGCR
jgi:hypothetical protein